MPFTSQLTAFTALLMVLGNQLIEIESRGINLGICDDTRFQCRCGADPKANVRLPIKQCTFFYRWKPKCRPCNKITTYDVCPKYINCLRCHEKDEENGRCTECPPGKYGAWCAGVCACKNGGTCDRDGKCHCIDSYQGAHCEISKNVYCPHPVTPKNGFADYSSTKEGSVIVYRCKPGYRIIGKGSSQCLKLGVWANATPLCVAVCSIPNNLPSNTQVKATVGDVTIQLAQGREEKRLPNSNVSSDSKINEATEIAFSCDPGYVLDGYEVLTCTGAKWNAPVPRCVKQCKPLSEVENGQISPLNAEYQPDSVVTFTCNVGYVIKGAITATCQADGTWSTNIPKCEQLVLCDDPGTPTGGSRQATAPFTAGATITYTCKKESIMIGNDKIVCSSDGQWSDSVPVCLTVSEIKVTCQTTGDDVMMAANEPVRIQCPANCAQEPGNVWGTVIYEAKSYVCKAAVHSGKLKGKEGGAVVVINNQRYSGFVGSTIHEIKTQSKTEISDSFRFSNTLPTVFGNGAITTACPKGWAEVDDICILAVEKEKIWTVADSVCRNIDAELTAISSDKLPKLASVISTKEKSYWTKPTCNFLQNDGVRGLSIETGQDCQELRSFICQLRLLSKGAKCQDPGRVAHSERQEKNSVDGNFYEGSELTYTCNKLFYIDGGETIKCKSDGSWDFPKPLCHRIPACEELSAPANGYLEYTEPMAVRKSAASRVGFPSARRSPLPRFGGHFPLSITAKTNETAAKEGLKIEFEIPQGYHKVATRASVRCSSKLYKRIGSRVRRCLKSGQWSGSLSSCIPICGQSSASRSSFVAHGNTSNVGEWPWQVAVSSWWTERGIYFIRCGGSLLNENWVMTAAHCVTFQESTEVIRPQEFQIYLGKHYRNDSSDDEYVQTELVSEIHVHPDYDPVIFDSDIALLRLSKPVELTSRVRPVCLPTFKSANEHLVEGKIGVVTGWGVMETDLYPEELQQARVPVVPSSQCTDDYREAGLPLTVTDYMFCAGYKEGKADACSGDSGGPVVFQDRATNKWIQEGIVSWGSPNGCGNKNQYGGYTRVERFIEWIQEFL